MDNRVRDMAQRARLRQRSGSLIQQKQKRRTRPGIAATRTKVHRSHSCAWRAPRRMKMNDWGVPMRGLKPAATAHRIMPQSFATRPSSSSGGGLQPALPGSIFEGEPRRQGVSKRRQTIGPAVRPGFSGNSNERRRRGTRHMCRSFGPQFFVSLNPALTADCGTHLTLWVLVDLDVDLDLDLDVDPDYPVRHELSQA